MASVGDVPSNRETIYIISIYSRGRWWTNLSNKLSGNTIRLDLPYQLKLYARYTRKARTMTKDLSLTVPFSPAIVLGPSIIKGDLIAIISSISYC